MVFLAVTAEARPRLQSGVRDGAPASLAHTELGAVNPGFLGAFATVALPEVMLMLPGAAPIETLETFFKAGVIAVTIDAWSHFDFANLEWFIRPPLVAVSALLRPVP